MYTNVTQVWWDALSDMLEMCAGGAPWTEEHAKEWWSEHVPTEVSKELDEEPRILMPSMIDVKGS